MELSVMDCLKGMASEMRWGIRDAIQRIESFSCYAYFCLKALTRAPRKKVVKLCKQSYAHIDQQLSKKGAPRELRVTAGLVLMLPAIVVRAVLVGGVITLWLWHGPQVAVHVWTSVEAAEKPNKKRTPKKYRPWNGPDNFDDVRVRISELTQYPKQ